MRNGITWLNNLWGRNKSKEALKAWQYVFNKDNPEVQKVLKDLSVYCNFYQTSFNPSSKEHTAFNEGGRDVFLHIIEMISLDITELEKY